MSQTLLYQALTFFCLEPIFHTCGKLSWTHYWLLLRVPSIEVQHYYRSVVGTLRVCGRKEAQIKAGRLRLGRGTVDDYAIRAACC